MTRIEFKEGGQRGVAGENAAKTHCVHGHEFTPENTRVRTGMTGGIIRYCLKCETLAREKARRRRKPLPRGPFGL